MTLMNTEICFILPLISLLFVFVAILRIKSDSKIINIGIAILLISIPLFFAYITLEAKQIFSRYNEEQKLKENNANYIFNDSHFALNCFKEDGRLFCTGLDAGEIAQVKKYDKINK